VWQYLSRLQKGGRAHRCPQRTRIADPKPFSLQTGHFLGTTTGAMMRIADPRRHPSAASPSWWWAEAIPPLWQYLSRQADRQTKAVEPIAAPKGGRIRGPQAFPPANWPLPRGRTKGPSSPSWTPSKPASRWWAKAMPRCGGTSRVCQRSRPPPTIPLGHSRTLRVTESRPGLSRTATLSSLWKPPADYVALHTENDKTGSAIEVAADVGAKLDQSSAPRPSNVPSRAPPRAAAESCARIRS
jgi:hypothetical protein